MTPEDRHRALSRWFGLEGMDARFIRMHIDSCDYALSEYQSVADPIADPELKTFNIDRDRQWTLPVVKEATALGAAVLAGYGVGIYDSIAHGAEKCVKWDKVFTPNMENHKVYEELYPTWRKVYDAQLRLSDEHVTRYMWSAPGV